MRHTRSIQPIALLAMVGMGFASAELTTPFSKQRENSALRHLAAVGEQSEEGRTIPLESDSLPMLLASNEAEPSLPELLEVRGEDLADDADATDDMAAVYAGGDDWVDHGEIGTHDFLAESAWDVYNADQAFGMVNRAIDLVLTLGGGYDSNPRLEAVGDPEWVYWANLAFSLNPDYFNPDSRGLYYGLNINSGIFSYGTDRARGGRDQGELDVGAVVGLRGAKTEVRFGVDYQLNNGNLIDFSELDRETRRADSNDWDIELAATRSLDHSVLTGSARWMERDFDSDTFLNDTTGFIWDVGWLYSPGFAPKTDLGAGFKSGTYDTDRNFEQQFYEPSFRFAHRVSPKTTVNGSVGVTFIDYDGVGSITENSFVSFGLGADWAPTPKTSFGLQLYREFAPSYTSVNQDFITDGASIYANHLLPGNWTLRASLALESAEYFSTSEIGTTIRQDDYWRLGADLSHPLQLTPWLDGSVSGFYYYNQNDSNIAVANFDQIFTGLKFGFSY